MSIVREADFFTRIYTYFLLPFCVTSSMRHFQFNNEIDRFRFRVSPIVDLNVQGQFANWRVRDWRKWRGGGEGGDA